jgi:hypothetical protein
MKHPDLVRSVFKGFYTEPIFEVPVRHTETLMAEMLNRKRGAVYAWRRYLFSDVQPRKKYAPKPCPRWASAFMALISGQHPLYELHWPALTEAMAEGKLPLLRDTKQAVELQGWRVEHDVDVAMLKHAMEWTNPDARRHTFSAIGKEPGAWFIAQLIATGEVRDWRGNLVATITRRTEPNPLSPRVLREGAANMSAPLDAGQPPYGTHENESISEGYEVLTR